MEMFCSERNGLTSTQHKIIKKYYSLSEESRELIDSILDRFVTADNMEVDEEKPDCETEHEAEE